MKNNQSKERLHRQTHSFPPCRAQTSMLQIYVSRSTAFPQLYRNCFPNLGQRDYVALPLYSVPCLWFSNTGKLSGSLQKSVMVYSWIPQDSPNWCHEKSLHLFSAFAFAVRFNSKEEPLWKTPGDNSLQTGSWETSDMLKIPKLVLPLPLCKVLLYISERVYHTGKGYSSTA